MTNADIESNWDLTFFGFCTPPFLPIPDLTRALTAPATKTTEMKYNVMRFVLALAASLLMATSARAWELKFGTNLPPVDFHGFVSQGFLLSTDYNYLADDTTEGSFEFFEAALNASITPFPRTRIAAQGFAFDVGEVGNHDLMLDYALVEYTFDDRIGFRGGRIRRPEGIYYHILDVDLARTSVLLPQGMYDARWRDFLASIDGGEIFGNLPLNDAGGLSYELYAGVSRPTTSAGLARWILNMLPPGSTADHFNSPFTSGAQLWWSTPIAGLRAGMSYQRLFDFQTEFTLNLPPPPLGPGPVSSADAVDVDIGHVSLEYLWNRWTFQAEYQRSWVSTSPDAFEYDTWYAGAAHRFNRWFETGAYYTEYYSDVTDRDGSNLAVAADAFQKDVALSLRFDPTDWWTLKLEGHCIRGTALLRDNDHNPARNDDVWWMLAVKTTFSF